MTDSDSLWYMQSGANLTGDGCRFDIWTTNATAVEVEIVRDGEPERHPMEPTGEGRFTATVPNAVAGDRLSGHAEIDAVVLDIEVDLFEAVFVEQDFDTLTRSELALGVLCVDALLPATQLCS